MSFETSDSPRGQPRRGRGLATPAWRFRHHPNAEHAAPRHEREPQAPPAPTSAVSTEPYELAAVLRAQATSMLAVDFFHVDCAVTLRAALRPGFLEADDRYLHVLGRGRTPRRPSAVWSHLLGPAQHDRSLWPSDSDLMLARPELAGAARPGFQNAAPCGGSWTTAGGASNVLNRGLPQTPVVALGRCVRSWKPAALTHISPWQRCLGGSGHLAASTGRHVVRGRSLGRIAGMWETTRGMGHGGEVFRRERRTGWRS